MGGRRSRPNARRVILTPGGACRRLYSARSTISTTRWTTSAGKPSATISSGLPAPPTKARRVGTRAPGREVRLGRAGVPSGERGAGVPSGERGAGLRAGEDRVERLQHDLVGVVDREGNGGRPERLGEPLRAGEALPACVLARHGHAE